MFNWRDEAGWTFVECRTPKSRRVDLLVTANFLLEVPNLDGLKRRDACQLASKGGMETLTEDV